MRDGVDLLVGTPERVKSMLQKKNKDFALTDTKYIVLDEVDTLYNHGFWDDVKFNLLKAGCQSGFHIFLKNKHFFKNNTNTHTHTHITKQKKQKKTKKN